MEYKEAGPSGFVKGSAEEDGAGLPAVRRDEGEESEKWYISIKTMVTILCWM